MPRGLGSGRQPSICASRSRGGRPRLRHCSGQIGGEPPRGRAAIWRSPPKATFAPGSWSSTSWRRRSWPRPSVCWLLGTPEATAVRPVTERELAAAGRSRTAAAISRLRRRTRRDAGRERAGIVEQVASFCDAQAHAEVQVPSKPEWSAALRYGRSVDLDCHHLGRGGRPSANSGSTVYGLIPSPSPAARPKLETVFLSI